MEQKQNASKILGFPRGVTAASGWHARSSNMQKVIKREEKKWRKEKVKKKKRKSIYCIR